jgi:hypothetical protein
LVEMSTAFMEVKSGFSDPADFVITWLPIKGTLTRIKCSNKHWEIAHFGTKFEHCSWIDY